MCKRRAAIESVKQMATKIQVDCINYLRATGYGHFVKL
jgi:hypothetical protein